VAAAGGMAAPHMPTRHPALISTAVGRPPVAPTGEISTMCARLLLMLLTNPSTEDQALGSGHTRRSSASISALRIASPITAQFSRGRNPATGPAFACRHCPRRMSRCQRGRDDPSIICLAQPPRRHDHIVLAAEKSVRDGRRWGVLKRRDNVAPTMAGAGTRRTNCRRPHFLCRRRNIHRDR
jgi:hypothetical protein